MREVTRFSHVELVTLRCVTWQSANTNTLNTGSPWFNEVQCASAMVSWSGPSSIRPPPSGSFIFPSCNKEVNSLVGVQHLSGSLCSCDCSQLVGIVTRVQGSAGPAGLLRSTARCEHVTHLAVEMRERGQSIKYQVLDPFDGVPKEKKRGRSEFLLGSTLYTQDFSGGISKVRGLKYDGNQ